MKTFKIIIVSIFLLGAGFVGAKGLEKMVNVENTTQVLYAKSLEGMQVYKVVDDKTSCYIVPTFVNGNRVNTAISCVK